MNIHDKRLNLLLKLAEVGGYKLPNYSYSFAEMSDGQMGSYKICLDGVQNNNPFGRECGEISFQDADGNPVLATLYLDKNNDPLEVDIWKINYSPLIAFPLI